MGCFSISCNASNLPIYNHKIGLVLLKPSKYATTPKNFICSSNGSHAYFTPTSPIIYGKCDTYGNIEEIEENDSFHYTCDLLGIPHTENDFHKWVEQDWMEKPRDYYVTFFRREILDGILEYTNENYSLFHSSEQDWILHRFPHIFQYKTKLEGRYCHHYTTPENKSLFSDGSWVHGEKNKGFYSTVSLVNYIGEKYRDEIFSQPVETNLEFLMKKERDENGYSFKFSTELDVRKLSDTLIRAFADIYNVGLYMYATNRYFYPVFSGPQHNEYLELSHLNGLTKQLIEDDSQEN